MKKKKGIKRKKKDSQLLIRLDSTMRDEFAVACDELDTSASREIRRFIKQFLVQYNERDVD